MTHKYPLSPLDFRSFLGLAEYYRRFVDGFSYIASPLTKLTQKNTKFQLTDECKKSFQMFKDGLTSAPILTLLEEPDVFIVYCDASHVGLGCISM